MWNFVLNIFRFYAVINTDFAQYLDNFYVQSLWNKDDKVVEIDLISKDSFSFYIENHGRVDIAQGQRFKTVKSRKFYLNWITELLASAKFTIFKSICYNNKVNIIFAAKM